MPIQKRLTEAQRKRERSRRLSQSLPKGWKQAIRHDLIQRLTYNRNFDQSAEGVDRAIRRVTGWKGASDIEKVFVLALDLLLEKGTGEGVLDPDQYNRLWEHLLRNDDKLEFGPRQTFIWDIYHDHFKLNNYEAGELSLPEIPRKVKIKLKRKRK